MNIPHDNAPIFGGTSVKNDHAGFYHISSNIMRLPDPAYDNIRFHKVRYRIGIELSQNRHLRSRPAQKMRGLRLVTSTTRTFLSVLVRAVMICLVA